MAEPVNKNAAAFAGAEWVTVMGMRVPLPLKERIVAAVRKKYDGLTAGMDDDAAIRAVTKYWFITTLAEHEEAEAEAPVGEKVEATRAEYAQRARIARLKALQDAALITEEPQGPDSPA